MNMIDVHDLPEPVAAAIAAMVETLRAQTGGSSAAPAAEVRSVDELDAVLEKFFATDDATPSSLPVTFSREDIYFDHD